MASKRIKKRIFPNRSYSSKKKTSKFKGQTTLDFFKKRKVKAPNAKKKRKFREISKPTLEEGVKLNEDQNRVVELALQRENVFFTGEAGTGKSLLIATLFEQLTEKYSCGFDNGRVVKLATTGIASVNIDGQTLHRKRVFKSFKKSNNWRIVKAIIIDEVSMLDGQLFDDLDRIAKKHRDPSQPFGGIQLICTGDPFQLPPVKGQGGFFFEAKEWENVIDHHVYLRRVYRQTDPVLINILRNVRYGHLTPEDERILRQHCIDGPSSKKKKTKKRKTKKIEPTRLFSQNAQVNRINERRLSSLPGKSYSYVSHDTDTSKVRGRRMPSARITKTLDSYTTVQSTVNLKLGAQVMLLKNLADTELVNGLRGIVTGFQSAKKIGNQYRIIQGEEEILSDQEEDSYEAEPLYASDVSKWSRTVLKRQKGVGYFPIVTFFSPSAVGSSSRRSSVHLITPERIGVKLSGSQSLERLQIPLKCAWAMTIHKCQGLTLSSVEICMSNLFCCGHFYVGLSRVTSLSGLRLVDFDVSQVRSDGRVVRWMRGKFGKEIDESVRIAGESFGAEEDLEIQPKRKKVRLNNEEECEEVVFSEDEEEEEEERRERRRRKKKKQKKKKKKKKKRIRFLLEKEEDEEMRELLDDNDDEVIIVKSRKRPKVKESDKIPLISLLDDDDDLF